MPRSSLRLSAQWLCALLLVILPLRASSIEGMAIAIQTTSQWSPGNLTLVNLPGNEKITLREGDCWGPCFSPEGSRVAYIVTNGTGVQDGIIYTMTVDGGNQLNTGIHVRVGHDDGHRSGGTALYWLNLNGEEWFYWASKYHGGGWFRCKHGTTNVEHVASAGGAGFWGGVDRSGRFASGTAWSWNPLKFDLTTGHSEPMTSGGGGCNTSVSPDGQFVLHNLNTGYWSGQRHTHAMIRRFDNKSEVKLIPCNGGTFDNHRWSHHSMDILMWRHYTAGNGVIYNRVTEERIPIGGFVPYDFFPGAGGPIQHRFREPAFSPAGGLLPGGQASVSITSASEGISIRYTTDGSEPTPQHGTPLENADSVAVSISAGQSLTLKAIAYRAQSDTLPSIIASSVFTAPDEIPVLSLSSPLSGETYMIGQTLPIRWSVRAGEDIQRIDPAISLDGGEHWFEGMTEEALQATSGSFDWRIPPRLLNQDVHSDQVLIRIEVYGNRDIFAETGLFSILDPDRVPLKSVGTPIVSVLHPTGSGLRDINSIRDDVYPPPGSGFGAAYDTYNEHQQSEVYFGYEFSDQVSFTSVIYHFGSVGDFGGQFTSLAVQVRDNDGTWNDVIALTSTPEYSAAAVNDFSSYTLRFTETTGYAIRVIGAPQNGEWVGCSELDVMGRFTTATTQNFFPAATPPPEALSVNILRNGSASSLVLRSGSRELLDVSVLTAAGKTIARTMVAHTGGATIVSLDNKSVSPGFYTVVVRSSTETLLRKPFIFWR